MKNKFKVKPTDMCIYIDEHVYEENHDVAKIFDYLQKIFYCLATNRMFFKNFNDYAQFSLFGATKAYLRLTNKHQFLPETDPHKLTKIKSILNWVKQVLYPYKVEYQNYAYNDVIKIDQDSPELVETVKKQLEVNMKESITNDLLKVDIECYFETIEKTIKNFLKKCVYANDPILYKNIYISCLITLLRGMTMSRENKEKVFTKDNKFKLNSDENLNSIYNQEALKSPIVWHLDKDMRDYIAVLVNEIKDLICSDIRELTRYYDSSEELMKNILMEPVSNLNEDED